MSNGRRNQDGFAAKINSGVASVGLGIFQLVVVLLAIVGLVIVLVAGKIYFVADKVHNLIEPLAQRATTEHPDDLAFVGGMFAFVCIVPEYFAIENDIEEVTATTKMLKDQARECGSSLSSFIDCAEKMAKDVLDAEQRSKAVAYAKKVKHTYSKMKEMLSEARRIADELPAYDNKTRAVKTIFVKTIAHFQEMGAVALLQYDFETDPEEWANTALAQDIPDAQAWVEQLKLYYPEVVPLMEMMPDEPTLFVIVAGLMMLDPSSYGIDTTMQRAPAFAYARQHGCFQGTGLTYALARFVEDNYRRFSTMSDAKDEDEADASQ